MCELLGVFILVYYNKYVVFICFSDDDVIISVELSDFTVLFFFLLLDL